MELVEKSNAESRRAEAESRRAEAESRRAEQERKQREKAEQHAAVLAEKLRQVGIDPDTLS
jgi:hypothetical protein